MIDQTCPQTWAHGTAYEQVCTWSMKPWKCLYPWKQDPALSSSFTYYMNIYINTQPNDPHVHLQCIQSLRHQWDYFLFITHEHVHVHPYALHVFDFADFVQHIPFGSWLHDILYFSWKIHPNLGRHSKTELNKWSAVSRTKVIRHPRKEVNRDGIVFLESAQKNT